MGTVRGIAEIVLNTSDLPRLASFYTRVLGLHPVLDSDAPNPAIVFLRVADIERPLGSAHPQVLALIDPARHPPAQGRFDDPTPRRSTLNHIAFEIDESDHERELHRLTDLGLSPTTARFPAMHAKALFFRDPDGNTVELICHDSDTHA